MNRKSLFVFLLSLMVSVVNLHASDWIKLTGDQPAPAQIQLNYSNISTSQVHFSMEGFWKKEIQTEQGMAWLISADQGAALLKLGAPDVPVFASSLIIPDLSKMKVEVISAQYQDFEGVLLAPSKGNLDRTINPADVPFTFGPVYQENNFYPGELSKLRDPYIVRDYRGQTLLFQPVQYNPVSKVLRVYYDLVVEVTEAGAALINPLVRNQQDRKMNRQFEAIYNRHFLNAQASRSYVPLEEHGNMLVICYGDYLEEIQDLVDWKIQTGTPVEVVDVATIGNSAAIKQYIANYYTDNDLTFVLLVGDAPQVPSSSIGGNDSDNNYSYIVGNDHYPDVFVGRFSAQTEAQVTTQVVRTLNYEQDPISDTAWYTKSIGIASDQGPGDDNEYDYVHMRNILNTKLLPYTYNYGYEFYDGSQGGNDAPGNPTQSQVAAAVNSGATIINYVGHGSDNAWSTSNFSSNNVNQLTNVGKLPFIISVACVNGNFVNGSCFAEAWLRAEDNGEPAGAVATLMSTINQSWNPPMRGQDEMNDILTEAFSDNIKRTFGGITMNGCMGMNDAYGSQGDEMTDTWALFGDPSIMVRTAIPGNMTVNHPATLSIGETTLSVNCNVDGALVAFSMDGDIYGTAVVENGSATLTFEPLSLIGTASLVVTAYNYRPYIGTLEIEAMAPYITYTSNILNDGSGNNNGMADYAEDILLTLALTNVGSQDAIGVQSTLSSTSQYVTIITNTAYYGDILQGDTVSVIDGFEFEVANNVPDGGLIAFKITSEDQNGMSWVSNFMIIGHAPKMHYQSFSINDNAGNGDGRLDPGETVDLTLTISNTGSSDAYNVEGQLSSISDFITMNSGLQSFGDLNAGEFTSATFNVTISDDAQDGALVPFILDLFADHDISASDAFNSVIILTRVLVVDLSQSPSEEYMLSCFNNLYVAADHQTDVLTDMSQYRSLFVLLGVFPDNHILSEAEGQQLSDFLSNGGRIYMEGGDTWVDDDPTAVHALFYIDGLDAGSDNLTTILGTDGTMMEGYSFVYQGHNNYMDQIAPLGEAVEIFANETPAFGTGVAYENEIYKTIGCSFEFAGLTDELSTKDEVMAEMLEFFGVYNATTGMADPSANDFSVTAYPNPSHGKVNFDIVLTQQATVSLGVFDVTGRKVSALSQQTLTEGTHTLHWVANDVESGIYFYTLTIGSKMMTQKLILSR